MQYMIEELTSEDIDLLMNGLDAIGKAENASEGIGYILLEIMSKGDESMLNKAELEANNRRIARRHRDYQVMLLKAKLAKLALKLNEVDYDSLLDNR